MVELPYGLRKMKLSDGTKLEVANVIIQFGIAETIRRYNVTVFFQFLSEPSHFRSTCSTRT